MNPAPWTILAGKHSVGMDPETETDWARAFLVIGLFVGFLIGANL